MKCVRCNKERSLTQVSMKHNGSIPGTGGMKKYDAICHDCIKTVPIDDTTMKSREPGEDDDLETPMTEFSTPVTDW